MTSRRILTSKVFIGLSTAGFAINAYRRVVLALVLVLLGSGVALGLLATWIERCRKDEPNE